MEERAIRHATVDLRRAPGVELADSSTSAPRGPSRGDPRAEGLLSLQVTTEIRCQVRTPHGICDRRLAVVSERVEPTGRTVADLDDVPAGAVGAYCPKCQRASVYEAVA